jgi:outer membrane receptor protein involved in Fe transport
LLLVAAASPAVAQDSRHRDEHGRHDKDYHRHDRVEGHIVSSDGAPIAGAHVVLIGATGRISAESDRKGTFHFEKVAGGTYNVIASAPGYATLTERAIAIEPGAGTLSLVLFRATNASLVTIGEVRTSAGGSVSTSSGPSLALSAQSSAAAGQTSVADMLWSQLALTPVLPLGGGSNATVSYAVRGPDPTETLVDVDGHQVNNGNTGDFDLSLVDPAALQTVQVVYGISPSSLLGPNTIGGALNILTLQPTQEPHAMLRLFGGSYGNYAGTVQTTGTQARLGYALSLHGATASGSVNQIVDGQSVGSGFLGNSAIAKLRYGLGGANGYGYVQIDVRNENETKDLSALLTSYTPPAYHGGGGNEAVSAAWPLDRAPSPFTVYSNTGLGAHQADYGLDLQLPLGRQLVDGTPATMLSFSHLTGLASQSVWGPGVGAAVGSCQLDGCQYLYDQRDLRGDDWLELDRRFSSGLLSLKYDLGTEALTTQYVQQQVQAHVVFASAPMPDDGQPSPPTPAYTVPLAQTQRSLVLRYDGSPTAHVHYSLATYLSNFSTFGSSVDPRAGFVWTPSGNTALRASVGTTFQAPQLSELLSLPPADRVPVGGIVYTGNPNLQPDRATEYDVGIERIFGRAGRQLHLSADAYQNDLRATAEQLVVKPLPGCPSKEYPVCPVSYPVNAGDGIYRGIDLRADQQLGAFDLRAGWDVDSSFLTTIPNSVQDGTLVPYQQSLGQPLHKAYLGMERDAAAGFSYGANLDYEGAYNELNRPPYATLDAHVTYRQDGYQFGLYGTNLTNVYANPFTIDGGGVPYGAQPGTPMIPTNAYVLQGAKIVLVITRAM